MSALCAAAGSCEDEPPTDTYGCVICHLSFPDALDAEALSPFMKQPRHITVVVFVLFSDARVTILDTVSVFSLALSGTVRHESKKLIRQACVAPNFSVMSTTYRFWTAGGARLRRILSYTLFRIVGCVSDQSNIIRLMWISIEYAQIHVANRALTWARHSP
jgi:hypothetical protein